MDRLDRILALVRQHVPDLRLVHKAEVPWMRWAGAVLRPAMPEFMTHYATVVGDTVYLPRPVERIDREVLAATLAHELIHQLDQARWGPVFYVSYAVGLPTGRGARAVWERRAYAVDLMLAHHQEGERGLHRKAEQLVRLFSGPGYLWMWAGRRAAREFLRPTVEAVRSEELQQTSPYLELLAAWCGDEANP